MICLCTSSVHVHVHVCTCTAELGALPALTWRKQHHMKAQYYNNNKKTYSNIRTLTLTLALLLAHSPHSVLSCILTYTLRMHSWCAATRVHFSVMGTLDVGSVALPNTTPSESRVVSASVCCAPASPLRAAILRLHCLFCPVLVRPDPLGGAVYQQMGKYKPASNPFRETPLCVPCIRSPSHHHHHHHHPHPHQLCMSVSSDLSSLLLVVQSGLGSLLFQRVCSCALLCVNMYTHSVCVFLSCCVGLAVSQQFIKGSSTHAFIFLT